MKDMKKKVNDFRVLKETSIGHSSGFIKFVDHYEEDNILVYVNQMPEKLVFTEILKDNAAAETLENVRSQQKNAWDWVYFWCKGELYDIKALREAIEQRDLLEKQLRKLR